jgi:hypothetical protein
MLRTGLTPSSNATGALAVCAGLGKHRREVHHPLGFRSFMFRRGVRLRNTVAVRCCTAPGAQQPCNAQLAIRWVSCSSGDGRRQTPAPAHRGTGVAARAVRQVSCPWSSRQCERSLPHLLPGGCKLTRSCGLCMEAHACLQKRECCCRCRSTPRSRAGSAELQEDAAGPAGRPEDLLPTVHEDDEPPPLPDPQVQQGHTLRGQLTNVNTLALCALAHHTHGTADADQ